MTTLNFDKTFEEFLRYTEIFGREDAQGAVAYWDHIIKHGSCCQEFEKLLKEISGDCEYVRQYLLDRALEIKKQRAYEEQIENLTTQKDSLYIKIDEIEEEALEAGVNPVAETSKLTQDIVWNDKKIKKAKSDAAKSKERVHELTNACDVQVLKHNVSSGKGICGVSETLAHNINKAINKRQNNLFDWFGLELEWPLGAHIDDLLRLEDMRKIIIMLKLLEKYSPKLFINYSLDLMNKAYPIDDDNVSEYSLACGKEIAENYRQACIARRSKK